MPTEINEDYLPYCFDLFYDIKSKKKLKERLADLEKELKELKEMVVNNDIKFD
jgi:hypothetical protein